MGSAGLTHPFLPLVLSYLFLTLSSAEERIAQLAPGHYDPSRDHDRGASVAGVVQKSPDLSSSGQPCRNSLQGAYCQWPGVCCYNSIHFIVGCCPKGTYCCGDTWSQQVNTCCKPEQVCFQDCSTSGTSGNRSFVCSSATTPISSVPMPGLPAQGTAGNVTQKEEEKEKGEGKPSERYTKRLEHWRGVQRLEVEGPVKGAIESGQRTAFDDFLLTQPVPKCPWSYEKEGLCCNGTCCDGSCCDVNGGELFCGGPDSTCCGFLSCSPSQSCCNYGGGSYKCCPTSQSAQCCRTDGDCTIGTCCGNCACCDPLTQVCEQGGVCKNIPQDWLLPVVTVSLSALCLVFILYVIYRVTLQCRRAEGGDDVCQFCDHPAHHGVSCGIASKNKDLRCSNCLCAKSCHADRCCSTPYTSRLSRALHGDDGMQKDVILTCEVINSVCNCNNCNCRNCVPETTCQCECQCEDCKRPMATLTWRSWINIPIGIALSVGVAIAFKITRTSSNVWTDRGLLGLQFLFTTYASFFLVTGVAYLLR